MNTPSALARAKTSIPRPFPRGPISELIIEALDADPDEAAGTLERLTRISQDRCDADTAVLYDDDVQLSLFLLYSVHYGTYSAHPSWEWNRWLEQCRLTMEGALERDLRQVVPQPDLPEPDRTTIASTLFALTAADTGPSLSRYLARKATLEQAREFLVNRSIYTLREADPHSWAIPRLSGRAKAALVEIQSDEYGAGNPDRMHSAIFAQTMRGLGLSDSYGAYLDHVSAITLASMNTMSMFGFNARFLGAITGHLAAFEMTSSIPNRMYGNGFRRLGFDEEVTWYFDEHVEADAVHEQIASRDLAGSLGEDRPDLLADIMFGAAACLTIDGLAADWMLEKFSASESSLIVPLPE